MKSSKLLALLLAVLMLLGCFAGCKAQTPAATAPAAGTEAAAPAAAGDAAAPAAAERTTTKEVLILANKADVGTLAPFGDSSIQRSRVTMNIYDTLFIEENDGSLTPCLATSWDWTDDTHCVFHLREGVTFSNGNPFTAEDVLYSVQFAADSAMSDFFNWVDKENSKVIDDYTFELALTTPGPKAVSYIGSNCFLAMIDKETCEANLDAMATDPVGTGPYMLKEWIVGDTVTLEKNPNYWGEEAIIDTLIFRNVSEITQRTIELETGGVDVVYDLQASAVAGLPDTIKVVRQDGILVQNLYFNVTNDRPLANEDLRKAIAYAIDNEAVAKGSYDGGAYAASSFAGRGCIGSEYLGDGSVWYPQDLAKAKEYLAKAGYGEGEVTLKVVVDSNPNRVAAVEIVQNHLKQVGINMEISQYDFGTALGTCLNPANDWDIYVLGDGNPTAVLQCDRMQRMSAPFVTYTTDELQGLLDELFITIDEQKKIELLGKVSEYFNEHIPFVPLVEEEVIMAIPANLQNFNIFQSYSFYCKDLYFS